MAQQYFNAAANLEKIAAVNSPSIKMVLLAEGLKCSFFSKLCESAYHPFVRYNMTMDISKINMDHAGVIPEEATFFGLLHHLCTRQITARNAEADVATWHPVVQWLFAGVVNKDLRAGFTDTLLNKVIKGFLPTFDCMLAHKYDPKRIKSWPVAVQPKLDGVRCLVRIEGSDIRFMSRTGKEEFASFPNVVADLRSIEWTDNAPKVIWLDGELTSGNFNKTVGDVRRKSAVIEDVVLTVFEALSEQEFSDGSVAEHNERFERVASIAAHNKQWVKPVDQKIVASHEAVMTFYQEIRDEGGEGVIVKPFNGVYEPKRSYNWMKIKDQQSLDLEVIGTFEGEGKYAGKLGGVIVNHKGVDVRVGSGFTDADRERDDWLGLIIEVEFHEITPDGSLRHPRFKQRRFDKNVADNAA